MGEAVQLQTAVGLTPVRMKQEINTGVGGASVSTPESALEFCAPSRTIPSPDLKAVFICLFVCLSMLGQ